MIFLTFNIYLIQQEVHISKRGDESSLHYSFKYSKYYLTSKLESTKKERQIIKSPKLCIW
jgi:hypothetical protein